MSPGEPGLRPMTCRRATNDARAARTARLRRSKASEELGRRTPSLSCPGPEQRDGDQQRRRRPSRHTRPDGVSERSVMTHQPPAMASAKPASPSDHVDAVANQEAERPGPRAERARATREGDCQPRGAPTRRGAAYRSRDRGRAPARVGDLLSLFAGLPSHVPRLRLTAL